MEFTFGFNTLEAIFKSWKFISKHFKKTDFLNEDLPFLFETYSDERIIARHIPYVLVYKFYNGDSQDAIRLADKIKLTLEPRRFKIQDDDNTVIHSFQAKALRAFKDKISHDGSIVRLSEYVFNKKELIELKMQHAKYSDQVKSNLVLDWDKHKLAEFTTLRTHLKARYGYKLPPLSSTTLANTIGLSCILYFKSGKQYIPYLPKRTRYTPIVDSVKRNLAIFQGGIHVTASGALDFPGVETIAEVLNFHDFFTEEMYREILEEVGIAKNDIAELVPLALTRELLRAGKPQIFYGGILKDSITEADLKSRRIESIKRQKKNNKEKVEIENKSLNILDAAGIAAQAATYGLTLEVLGNLFFSQEYITSKK